MVLLSISLHPLGFSLKLVLLFPSLYPSEKLLHYNKTKSLKLNPNHKSYIIKR